MRLFSWYFFLSLLSYVVAVHVAFGFALPHFDFFLLLFLSFLNIKLIYIFWKAIKIKWKIKWCNNNNNERTYNFVLFKFISQSASKERHEVRLHINNYGLCNAEWDTSFFASHYFSLYFYSHISIEIPF